MGLQRQGRREVPLLRRQPLQRCRQGEACNLSPEALSSHLQVTVALASWNSMEAGQPGIIQVAIDLLFLQLWSRWSGAAYTAKVQSPGLA